MDPGEVSGILAQETEVTEDINFALDSILNLFSSYISNYVHLLNKFISHLRRVGSLKYERTMLIKFVKKLRHFNDSLFAYRERLHAINQTGRPLAECIVPIASMFVKVLEVLDLLNFYFTQSLQKEIVSKTLNFDLALNEEVIVAIEDTYNHFVKYTQWMSESLGIQSIFSKTEVVTFALKCAEEDGQDEDNDALDNIFVQEVIEVADELEYFDLTGDWTGVLQLKLQEFESQCSIMSDKWHEKFGKKK